MTVTLGLLLKIIALICFALATFGVAARINLTAAGLFCWLLAETLTI
jgi:hypothetical protein